MRDYYKLGDESKVPIPCTFDEWIDRDAKRICATVDRIAGIEVITIFYGEGPLPFQSMIFGGEHDLRQWKYLTWYEAEEGHKVACEVAGL